MRYEVSLREVVVDGCSGYYVAECVDLATGEIVRKGEVFSSLSDALVDFGETQRKWYEELGLCSTTDEWEVKVDIVLGVSED